MTTATAPKPAGTVADYKKPTSVQGLQKLAGPLLPQIKAALPSFLAKNADRMLRCLLTECQTTPALLDCSPLSLFGGLIRTAQLGLELGGPAGQAYLIPFKGSAQLVIGYKGFIALAHRSGKVRRITPRVVREGDAFAIRYGTNQSIEHQPAPSNAGKAVGYYAVLELQNGGIDFEYMTVDQAEAHRDRFALSKKGPWLGHFDEMALKTVIRKLAKRMPLSVEWVNAAGLDEAGETGLPQNLGNAVILGGPTDEAESLANRLNDARPPNETGDPEADPFAQANQNIDPIRA